MLILAPMASASESRILVDETQAQKQSRASENTIVGSGCWLASKSTAILLHHFNKSLQQSIVFKYNIK